MANFQRGPDVVGAIAGIVRAPIALSARRIGERVVEADPDCASTVAGITIPGPRCAAFSLSACFDRSSRESLLLRPDAHLRSDGRVICAF